MTSITTNNISTSLKKVTALAVALVTVFSLNSSGVALALPGDPSFREVGGYGLNLQGASDDPEAAKQEIADATYNLGTGWIRLNVSWAAVEDEPGKYDWSYQDHIADIALENHLKVMMVVHETPWWARESGSTYKHAPTDPQDYANFLAKVVERYSPEGILDYAVWNEPNNPIFWKDSVEDPNPNVDRYTELLKVASDTAKEINGDINIIAGSLSPGVDSDGWIAPYTFLEALYNNGAKDYFDSISHHPYSFPELPSYNASWNAWMQMSKDYGTQKSLRTIMTENGDAHKKIWITEFGAPTSGDDNSVSEQRQAQIYREAIRLHSSYDWVGPMFFYAFKDYETYGDSSDREDYFGLVRKDGTIKPGGLAIEEALNASRSTTATINSRQIRNGDQLSRNATIKGKTDPYTVVSIMTDSTHRCKTLSDARGNWSCSINLSDLRTGRNYTLKVGAEGLAAYISYDEYRITIRR